MQVGRLCFAVFFVLELLLKVVSAFGVVVVVEVLIASWVFVMAH
jgi:hypothetical protein